MNKWSIEKRDRVRCEGIEKIWADRQFWRFRGISRTWSGRVSGVKGEEVKWEKQWRDKKDCVRLGMVQNLSFSADSLIGKLVVQLTVRLLDQKHDFLSLSSKPSLPKASAARPTSPLPTLQPPVPPTNPSTPPYPALLKPAHNSCSN